MKKKFVTDLSHACSKDELRPALNNVIFDKGFAVCTDAHILVKQDLKLSEFSDEEIEQMNGCCIHREQFKEMFRYEEEELSIAIKPAESGIYLSKYRHKITGYFELRNKKYIVIENI